jgi:hypothetical protein
LVAPFLFVVALSFPERRRRSRKKESYSFNYFGVCSLIFSVVNQLGEGKVNDGEFGKTRGNRQPSLGAWELM